jgi:hypothetical protein
MRILVEVKKRHINNGQPCKSSTCPVALAVKERVKSSRVCVNPYEICVDNLYCPTPKSVARFITKFDRGCKPVQPFNFYLDI